MDFSLEMCPRIVGWKINENLTAFPNYWLQVAKKILCTQRNIYLINTEKGVLHFIKVYPLVTRI